ncbi:NAD(P)H-dependent oxidoreductase subunit E [bacterium]|nr:NAD(P)H-dependent oxidoreductase subunit E [bacterium]MBL7052227.1 NAD(P)H-dependent oxidoreductase subunit E [Candidatus Neomarinimicrobiota bacterium]
MSTQTVTGIIEKYNSEPKSLIAILQDIQANQRHLPKDALEEVATSLDIPLSQAYSVATFFKAFSLTPKGEYCISVCMGTACHVKGGKQVLEKLERDLSINAGETTDDLSYSLEEVHCVGCCGLAPVVTVNDDLFSKVKLRGVKRILKKYGEK